MGKERREKTDISRCQGKYPVLQIPGHSSFVAKGDFYAVMEMDKINLRGSAFPLHQEDRKLLRKFIFPVSDGKAFVIGSHRFIPVRDWYGCVIPVAHQFQIEITEGRV